MVSGIESKGLSQAISALRAFQMDERVVSKSQNKEQPVSPIKEQISEITPLRQGFSQQKADEIKQLAQNFDMEISNSDINYALTYGRSIMVDFSA